MIDDPIVIRKSRGLLVVSSSKPTDPIQLVRELSEDRLEVHLRNGSKYVEELQGGDDIQEIILEMMGYGTVEAIITFHAWPESQHGGLEFFEDEEDLQRIGQCIVDRVFSPTPYMNSKFLSMDLDCLDEEPDVKYYDGTYSRYDVTYGLRFRARVDAVQQVALALDEDLRGIAEWTVVGRRRAGINECRCEVYVAE